MKDTERQGQFKHRQGLVKIERECAREDERDEERKVEMDEVRESSGEK